MDCVSCMEGRSRGMNIDETLQRIYGIFNNHAIPPN